MNWLVLVVIGIFIVCAVNGMQKGLIKTIFVTGSLIIALLAAVVFSPILFKAFQGSEKLNTYLTEKVTEVMKFGEFTNQVTDKTEYVNDMNVPDSIKTMINDKVNVTGVVNQAAEDFTGSICDMIVKIILYTASYIIIFLASVLLLAVLSQTMDVISKLPLIKEVNKIAGLAIGLCQGLLIVWVMFILVTTFSGTEIGQTAFKLINKNDFLSFLYDNNLLMKVLTNKVLALF